MTYIGPSGPSSRVPALNVMPATMTLIAITAAIHGIRYLLPVDLDNLLLVHFAFIPDFFLTMGGIGAGGLLDILPWTSPVSYIFLHGDWLHLIMNMAFLLALGSGVEQRLGWRRFLVFYLITGVLALSGTMLMVLLSDGRDTVLVVGASGAISGLFGAACRFLFGNRVGWTRNRLLLRLGPGLTVLIVFVAINLIFALFSSDPFGGMRTVAWEAHLAGLLIGYAIYPYFLPPMNNPDPKKPERPKHLKVVK